jgi:hypothetical protein
MKFFFYSFSEVHYTSEMAFTFIQDILKWRADSRMLRGPYLAKLELIKQLRQTGSSKTIPKELQLTTTTQHQMSNFSAIKNINFQF